MSDTNTPDRKIIIAVDGFSSCGKSTFAKAIAARLGYIFIDTGAMYRAVTLYALEHGAIRSGIVDEEQVVRLLDRISIAFRFNPERGASDIYVDGERAEGRIRTIEVSNCVSRVSAIPEVRAKLVAMQQEMGRRKGVVMDGRDIGTVVFPDAELKLFMTADPRCAPAGATTNCGPRATVCRSRRSNATCVRATKRTCRAPSRPCGRRPTPWCWTTAA